MELKEVQKIVDEWIKENTEGYWKPNNIILRLMEETGELAREINHKYGEKPAKPDENEKDIGHEAADIFFTLICLLNSLDIDLEDSFKGIIEKYSIRDKDRYNN